MPEVACLGLDCLPSKRNMTQWILSQVCMRWIWCLHHCGQYLRRIAKNGWLCFFTVLAVLLTQRYGVVERKGLFARSPLCDHCVRHRRIVGLVTHKLDFVRAEVFAQIGCFKIFGVCVELRSEWRRWLIILYLQLTLVRLYLIHPNFAVSRSFLWTLIFAGGAPVLLYLQETLS